MDDGTNLSGHAGFLQLAFCTLSDGDINVGFRPLHVLLVDVRIVRFEI